MQKPKILVTGAGGQLAMSIRDLATRHSAFDFVFFTKSDLHIEDKDDLRRIFDQIHPRFCINCAAYTAVDKAELEKEAAFLINAEAVKNLAQICAVYKTKLIHLSTDYVFNGFSSVPYKETDSVDPLNEYGASKAKGEYYALNANPESVIIRTSWLYSEHGKNFVKTMLRLMKEKGELHIVNDQTGSPTYAGDLAQLIMIIITATSWLPGIYHYCNGGQTTWYDFAREIKNISGTDCQLYPVTSVEYPSAVKRPAYSLLDTTKIKTAYNVQIPLWQESLKFCLSRILD